MFTIILLTLLSFTTSSLLFDLKPFKPKCFIEDIFGEEVIFFKWRVFTETDLPPSDLTDLVSNIMIYIYDEAFSNIVFQQAFNSEKSKSSFKPKENGRYKLCVSLKSTYKKLKTNVQVNIKIRTDNVDGSELTYALTSKDVDKVTNELKKAVTTMKPIVNRQVNELDGENYSARETIKSAKWYKKLTYVQIGICSIVFGVHVVNFRKFLKSSRII